MKKSISWAFKRAREIIREEGIIILAKKSLNYAKQKLKDFIFPPFVPLYVFLKIKKLNKNINSLEKLVDSGYNDIPRVIQPQQLQIEILELLRILGKMKPKTVLEIGTANGGALFLFSRISSKDATIISLDLPEDLGGAYLKWRVPMYKSFALNDQKIYPIRADSHSQKTLERIMAILDGREIDFLFIDGDHSYNGVKKDFKMYSPLVKERGIIAFHDIVPGPKENVGGVPEFWSEIKGKYDSKEIVKDWNNGIGYGIGWVIK
ncbi:MAG: class I SAM-dependent methyltransferase [Nanoarchaeota archaeon]|nr:class I SAM-dependent methyltransferase [Nanoarchaeota archaeon]MCG2718056.1 class I SAM-dependent methyltransferase [Nanoarchaeota archaeon]